MSLGSLESTREARVDLACASNNFYSSLPGGGGEFDQWLGIGVPLRVSNPDPV